MPPGPVQSGPRPVIGTGSVCACTGRSAAGAAMPSSVAPAPSIVPPTKSRRVIESSPDIVPSRIRAGSDHDLDFQVT